MHSARVSLVPLACATPLLVGVACGPASQAGELDAAPTGDGSPPVVDTVAPTLKVMTFNIKSGRDSSLEAIASVIVDEAPDVVALQEVDVDTMRTGMVDQPHRLGQLTGMTSLFRTAIPYEGGAYGLAVLSEHPLISSTSTALTSVGEQRIVMTVEVALSPTRTITVANAHLGLDADTRITQAEEVVGKLADDPDVLLFGDFNDEPGTPPLQVFDAALRDAWKLAGDGDGFTIPVDTPTRRIDYIFLGDDWGEPLDIRVLETRSSDHRPVVATLPLSPRR